MTRTKAGFEISILIGQPMKTKFEFDNLKKLNACNDVWVI